jgi:predicted permease
MAIPGIRRVLRLRFTRRQIEREVDEEIAYHVARRAEQLRLQGLSPEEAMVEASKRFGDVAIAREQCIEEDVADMRKDTVMAFLDHARSDVRFALRSLKRAPAFTAVALITLVVGIASVTTIASFVYSYAYRPLPYPNANRIVAVHERRSNGFGSMNELSIDAARAVVADTRAFERTTIYQTAAVRAAVRGNPEDLTTLFVDSSFVPMFGLRAQVGRTLTSDEIASNAPVVMISDVLWRASLGSDSSIIGRPMRFGDELLTVVGVMPEGFRFPYHTALWRPLRLIDSSGTMVEVLGRLSPGASRQRATTELALVARRLARNDPNAYAAEQLTADDMIDRHIGGAIPLTAVFVGAAVFVLLIACSNVANLMLVRAAERRSEMAVRSAMGAGRARLLTQALTESAVLAVVAGVFGTLLSIASIKILLRVVPTSGFPSWLTFGVDGGVLLIVLAVVTVVVLVVGLTPAREGIRFDLVRALKVGGDNGIANTGVARSARRGMVVQLALSVVLFIGACLLVQTYRRLSTVDVGYPAAEIVEFYPFFDHQHYPNDTARVGFANAVIDRARLLPGVQHVALAGEVYRSSLPGIDPSAKQPDGHRAPPPDLRLIADGDSAAAFATRRLLPSSTRTFSVSDNFFETLGIPLIQGRGLTSFDAASSQLVAVVSRYLAEIYWPRQNPLGHTIQFGARGAKITIVGVVENVRDLQGGRYGIHADPRLDAYFSARQITPSRVTVLLRARGDVSAVQAGAQAIGRRVDPNVFTTVYTRAHDLEIQLMATRLFGALIGTFAISGLALSIIGIYGIVAYGIAQRTREIGVRIALGGTSRDVLTLILRQSLRFVAIGLVAGVLVSLAMSRGLQALLFGVSPTDPLTYLVACALFAAIATLACYLPARRVTRIDPMVALRSD